MLREMRVENLAIIEKTVLNWKPGFTAVSGETGAGKSVLVNALKILLGERAKADLIRPGADSLRVEAQFDLSKSSSVLEILRAEELEAEEGEVFLERQVFKTGKSRSRINGSMVTLSLLSKVADELIDLHGQHQQQSLLNGKTHIHYLDHFGKLEIEKKEYAQAYETWKTFVSQLNALRREKEEVEKRREFFAFQSQELAKAHLQEGEEEKLEAQIKILSQSEKIQEHLLRAEELIGESEDNLLTQMSRLEKVLGEVHRHTQGLEEELTRLGEVRPFLQELQNRLQGFTVPDAEALENIDQMNSRLAQLQALKMKYKKTVPELIALHQDCKAQLERLENFSHNEEALMLELKGAFEKLEKTGETLRKKRKAVGKKFEKEVNSKFSFLGMEHSLLKCGWTELNLKMFEVSSAHPNGLDEMEFQFLPNPGGSFQVLHSVISGGEASRVMLAIKTVLAKVDKTPLLIFDEIDTGIGGHTANRVGEALKELGEHHQVIAITHLHQVAAQARQHINVSKIVQGNKTQVEVRELSESERVRELARMMGDDSGGATQKHAREILTKSHPVQL